MYVHESTRNITSSLKMFTFYNAFIKIVLVLILFSVIHPFSDDFLINYLLTLLKIVENIVVFMVIIIVCYVFLLFEFRKFYNNKKEILQQKYKRIFNSFIPTQPSNIQHHILTLKYECMNNCFFFSFFFYILFQTLKVYTYVYVSATYSRYTNSFFYIWKATLN